ncbi:putative ABC exporter domain-containing protein, partial [Salmonella enterica]
SFAAVSAFFDWPILRMIPIIGWEISAFHLILLSPDLLNAAGMVLYLLTTILLVILAYRMPCNGDYYEDAAKFADTYAEMIKRK